MQEKPLVSVIIPVYNVEKYIKRCITSLQQQDYDNIEIIVVDDGSPDRSGEIADELSVRDSRIRVFHKLNNGVSSARNVGIENSRGQYLMFVDADDWVDNNYVSVFTDLLENNSYDIAMNYNYYADNGSPRWEDSQIKNEISRDEAAEGIYNGKIFVAVWNKLYKRKYLDEYNIRFREDIWFGEGMLFNIECLNHTMNVGILNKAIYHQEPNPNSAMRLFKLESYLCGLKSMEIQRSIVESFKPEVMDAWILHNYQYHQTIIDGLTITQRKNEYYDIYKEHVSQLRKGICIPLRLERSYKTKIKWILYYIAPSLTSSLLQKRAETQVKKV